MISTVSLSTVSGNNIAPIVKNISYQSTLVDILRSRLLCQGDQPAFIFLQNGETESKRLTYRELDRQARVIATQLQSKGFSGERALLLYPPGLEFIAAFFGCLYAGVIAVPLCPPKRNQNLLRLQSVVADAGAKLALTTQAIAETVAKHLVETPDLEALDWVVTDDKKEGCSENWQQPTLNQDSLAFFQYTSGSTGNPKGVMVTHGNLIHNQQMIQRGFGHTERTIFAGWLPLFHDMGLIGNVLQPLYLGVPCILMSPVDFLQKPYRWLQAISHYRATTSGGPNFAYDLCVRKITEEQKADLDLSSWEIAFNGAEPVRAETLERFATAFAPCGFRREAFYPCYGMAEATLFISGSDKKQAPVIKWVAENALEENQILETTPKQPGSKALVSVGKTYLDQEIRIVNPESLRECAVEQVGEIWISGDSVAKGYWNQPAQTATTFQAHVSDTGAGPFLRTGDLGYVQEDGELFVTGRLKDAIIIRGRNHYPQDIELTAEQSHPALIPQRSAAFSVEIDGQEKLVIVAEVERRHHERRQPESVDFQSEERRKQENIRKNRRQEHPDPGFEVNLFDPPVLETAISNIKQAVTANHGLQVHEVLLLRVGTIPKTSSGKIQRYACRQGFFDNSLTVVYPNR